MTNPFSVRLPRLHHCDGTFVQRQPRIAKLWCVVSAPKSYQVYIFLQHNGTLTARVHDRKQQKQQWTTTTTTNALVATEGICTKRF